MNSPPDDLSQRLRKYGQEHVLFGWERLSAEERAALVGQLQALDLDELRRLYARRDKAAPVPSADRIAPLPGVLPDAEDAEARRLGEQTLAAGEVATLVVK